MKQNKRMSFKEIFLLEVLFIMIFIMIPKISVVYVLQNTAIRDANLIEKIIVNINTYKKTNSLNEINFNNLYDKKLIPETMMAVNPNDKSYIPLNVFGNTIHFSGTSNLLKVVSTTYSNIYCNVYTSHFLQNKDVKSVKINEILIKDSTQSECIDGLNLIEIVLQEKK